MTVNHHSHFAPLDLWVQPYVCYKPKFITIKFSKMTHCKISFFWKSHLQRPTLLSIRWNKRTYSRGNNMIDFPFSRRSFQPRSPTSQADSEPPGKPKNTGVGSLSLLHGIFPIQESNWHLLHCRQILYQLSYQGRPEPPPTPPKMPPENAESVSMAKGEWNTVFFIDALIACIWVMKIIFV